VDWKQLLIAFVPIIVPALVQFLKSRVPEIPPAAKRWIAVLVGFVAVVLLEGYLGVEIDVQALILAALGGGAGSVGSYELLYKRRKQTIKAA
jgi:heme A synthase